MGDGRCDEPGLGQSLVRLGWTDPHSWMVARPGERLVARWGQVYGKLDFILQVSGSQERGRLRLLP